MVQYINMVKRILTLICALLVLCSCNTPQGRQEDDRLATEVALISTSIYGTEQANRTATPVPTQVPTEVPSATPTAALFYDPSDTPEATATVPMIVVPSDTPTPESTDTSVPVETRKVGHFVTRTPGPGYPTPDNRPSAANWRQWPVVPEISDTAADIYWYGVQELDTNPHYLSRVGDCHSESGVFLGIYDTEYYSLADEDKYLVDAINFFKGSFDTISYSVHAGLSVSSAMTNIWADPSVCERGESALECEIRVNNPSIMFVNLGSNWIPGVGMDVYYTYLSDIVRTLLDHGILPILSSKADNVEGDNSINETTAQVARDFDIPFYNFWAISQYLPNQGLDPTRDGIHLSIEAWNWRNYYALQTLYKVGQKLNLF